MKTDVLDFTTQKTLQDIIYILRGFANDNNALVNKIEEDAFGSDGEDIAVLLTGKPGVLKGPGNWGVQVYVADLGNTRAVELIALGDSIGSQVMMGMARTVALSQSIKKRDQIAEKMSPNPEDSSVPGDYPEPSGYPASNDSPETFLMVTNGETVTSDAGINLLGRICQGMIRTGEEIELYSPETDETFTTRVNQIHANNLVVSSAGEENSDISILTDFMFVLFPEGSEMIVYRKGEQEEAIRAYRAMKGGTANPQAVVFDSREPGDTEPFEGFVTDFKDIDIPAAVAASERPSRPGKVCPKCNAVNSADAQFCNACGCSLDATGESFGRSGRSDDDSDGRITDKTDFSKLMKEKKFLIPALAGAAVLLIIIIAVAVGAGGGSGETEESADPSDGGYSQGENEVPDESWKDNLNRDIDFISWDLDFSNSKQVHDDDTVSYDNIMLVSNNTGRDITGMAFWVTNYNGDYVTNMDPDVGDAPFYAEGFVPDGETGIMVAKMRVTKGEFELETKDNDHRLRCANASIEDTYLFRGEGDYVQPTGRIEGPFKSGGKPTYNAIIDNDCDYPVHEGARIVAYKTEYGNGKDRIRVSSAKGKVDRELAPNSYDNEIGSAFRDPGFEGNKYPWPASDYAVCVIDNQYSDGSHYADEFAEDYQLD